MVKRNKLWLLLITSALILSLLACAPPPPPTEEVPTPTIETLPQVSYEITHNPESRWQDITLTIKDQDGNPLHNVEVSYEQTDLDFFCSAPALFTFGKLENGTWVDYPDSGQQRTTYFQLGANSVEYYPWWMWSRAEPADNQWNIQGVPGASRDASSIDDGQFSNPDYFYPDNPGVRFHTFWVGPQFHQPSMVPSWIDFEDMEEFKKQFEEYITLAFNLNPTKHFDLYELTVEINFWSVWGKAAWEITDQEWQDAVDFVKWEAELIRRLDPDAKIAIDLGPYVYFPNTPAANWRNWIDKFIDAGVDFDVIGLEIHPASLPNAVNTVVEFESMLNSLSVYGKEIYLFEFGVRSEGLPEEHDFSSNWQAPVNEYTEEFQETLYLECLKALINNPSVVGVRYVIYRDPVDTWDSGYDTHRDLGMGLLREDRTPKPSYYALKDYWHSLLVSGSQTTNQNGEITLNAIPGIFEVTVNGQTELIHIAK